MTSRGLICLLLLLSVALASARRVELDELLRDTTRVESELDLVLERTKVNPLAKVHEGPMAPHASSAAEFAQERPIRVLQAKTGLRLPRIPGTQPVSLIEKAEKIGIDLQNTIEARLAARMGGSAEPQLDGPAPEDGPFYAARNQFHATKVSDTELRLRKLWPKPVIVEREPVQTADMYMNADEILPKDPGADAMLYKFNAKYGVFDQAGIPSDPFPPNSELLPRDKTNLTDTMRDYVSVFEAANKFGFDPEKDSTAVLDKMLASMWTKRWEFFANEKAALEAKKKEREDKEKLRSYPIDPLFPLKQVNVDDRGESLLGNVYTYVDKVNMGDPLPSIPSREGFKPETSFYGPAVHGSALNVDEIKPPPPVDDFAYPKWKDAAVPYKGEIKLVPITPEPMVPDQVVQPELKGADFDAINAKPATLMKLPKLTVAKPF